MGKYDDRPYDVGKCKPPRKNQFKPGVSGNPRGPRHKKKPGEASLKVLVHEAVNETVTVFLGGRETKLLVKELMVKGLVNDALSGTPPQRVKAYKALQETGAFEPSVEDHRMTPEMEEENAKKLVEWLIEKGLKNEETKHMFTEYERR